MSTPSPSTQGTVYPWLPPTPEAVAADAFKRGRKRGIWIGVIGTTVVWLVLGLIGIATEKDSTTTTLGQQAAPIASSVIATPSPSELTGDNGITVPQAAAIANGAIDNVPRFCQAIDIVGYEASRERYQRTKPQIGSDEFEGAVFDYFYQEYC